MGGNSNQVLQDARRQRELDQEALQRDMAARGFAQSGVRLTREMELHLESVKMVLAKAFEIRKEISTHVTELLGKESLDNFDVFLQSIVDGFVNSATRLPQSVSGQAVSEAMNRKVNQEAANLRGYINRQLSTLKTEVALGIWPPKNATMQTFNFSNNANVNLGTVIGDVNGSIRNLNDRGQIGWPTLLER